MQSIQSLSDENLVSQLRSAILDERKLALQILRLINEAFSRRLFADAGYPSLFEWLTREFGYSDATAMRRINSARALLEVPSLEKKIESGEVNLTNLSKVQSVIRAEEKRTGERMTSNEKAKAFELIEQKSSREAETVLAAAFPQAAPLKAETFRPINENEVRVQVTLTKAQLAVLDRVREVSSHSNFGASLSEIIEMLANKYLDKNDPLRREVKSRPQTKQESPPAPEVAMQQDFSRRKPIAPALRNAVLRRAEAMCEFVDPGTSHRCRSRYLIELDHVVPVALGGANDPRNLKALCRTHNLMMAERAFGKERMLPFRRG